MKIIIFFVAIFLLNNAIAQNSSKSISLKEAIDLAKNTGKLIFAQIESSDCDQCNYLGEQAYNNEEFFEELNKDFIPVYINTKSEDRNLINLLYNLNNEDFGTLFINGDNAMLHKFLKTTSSVKSYYVELKKALEKKEISKNLLVLEKNYSISQTNSDLEKVIVERNKLELNTDFLLDVYSTNIDSLAPTYLESLTFLIKQAPIKKSISDSILRKNSHFNALWYSLPSKIRTESNRKVIFKSMQKAISTRNDRYAFEVAVFADKIYGKNRIQGNEAFVRNMFNYYKQVKNVFRLMKVSDFYIDQRIMSLNVDSILKLDSLNLIKKLKEMPMDTSFVGDALKLSKTFWFKSKAQSYNSTLNSTAWFVYKNSKNDTFLLRALRWANKANVFFKSHESMDTEARLLYILGKKSEAIILLEKAIALKKERSKSKMVFKSDLEVLEKMKANVASLE